MRPLLTSTSVHKRPPMRSSMLDAAALTTPCGRDPRSTEVRSRGKDHKTRPRSDPPRPRSSICGRVLPHNPA
jgi:hypothetical protein